MRPPPRFRPQPAHEAASKREAAYVPFLVRDDVHSVSSRGPRRAAHESRIPRNGRVTIALQMQILHLATLPLHLPPRPGISIPSVKSFHSVPTAVLRVPQNLASYVQLQ
jgi:hypothetical protein